MSHRRSSIMLHSRSWAIFLLVLLGLPAAPAFSEESDFTKLEFGTTYHYVWDAANVRWFPAHESLVIDDPTTVATLKYRLIGPVAYDFADTPVKQQALCEESIREL